MAEREGQALAIPVAPRAAAAADLYRQGIVAGIIGAAVIAVWFLILDAIAGRPLYTPTVLGTALFHGIGGSGLETIAPSLDLVVMFTWVHGLVFAIIGVAAALLVDVAERNVNLSFGIWLLFLFFEFGFVAGAMLFAEPLLGALSWPAILVGNLLAAVAMGAYLKHRHPDLKIRI